MPQATQPAGGAARLEAGMQPVPAPGGAARSRGGSARGPPGVPGLGTNATWNRTSPPCSRASSVHTTVGGREQAAAETWPRGRPRRPRHRMTRDCPGRPAAASSSPALTEHPLHTTHLVQSRLRRSPCPVGPGVQGEEAAAGAGPPPSRSRDGGGGLGSGLTLCSAPTMGTGTVTHSAGCSSTRLPWGGVRVRSPVTLLWSPRGCTCWTGEGWASEGEEGARPPPRLGLGRGAHA